MVLHSRINGFGEVLHLLFTQAQWQHDVRYRHAYMTLRAQFPISGLIGYGHHEF